MYAWMRILIASTLVAGGASAQGFKYWDLADTSKIPKTLSATGLYSNIANKTLIAGAVLFDVNSPLFSDNSSKKRWVLLKPNTSIEYNDTSDYWGYPDSAVFIKQFALDTLPGNDASRVIWETRLLILRKEALDPGAPQKKTDNWYPFTYKWRADQKDADLVADTGLKTSLRWYPEGLGKPSAQKKWIFPSRDDCMRCHQTGESDSGHGRSVLGFFTAQLNTASPNTPGKNQLADLFDRKVLKGTRPVDWNTSPRWYGMASTDPKATLENKSRAYIAANCSGCHGTRGKMLGAVQGVPFNYDFHTGKPAETLFYRKTGWAYGLDDPDNGEPEDDPFKGVYLINPGYARKSVLLFRQTRRNTAPADSFIAFDPATSQMPPLATFERNEPALKVIGDWINSLPSTGAPTAVRAALRQELPSPTLRDRTVFLPQGLLRPGAAVSLVDLRGRSHPLRAAAPGVYPVPAHLPRGLYVLRVGAAAFPRQLL